MNCNQNIYIIQWGFIKFSIKVAWSLQFLGYLRTLSLKFQKARTRARKTSSLLVAFWNSKLKVLKYPRNCSLHATLILKVLKNPESANLLVFEKKKAKLIPNTKTQRKSWNTFCSGIVYPILTSITQIFSTLNIQKWKKYLKESQICKKRIKVQKLF